MSIIIPIIVEGGAVAAETGAAGTGLGTAIAGGAAGGAAGGIVGAATNHIIEHFTHDHSTMDHSTMDHSTMDHSTMDHSTMDHSTMGHIIDVPDGPDGTGGMSVSTDLTPPTFGHSGFGGGGPWYVD